MTMDSAQEAVVFPCEGETLIGVLARPANPARIGVVLIVGGPQYRVGSHRQFLLLSRALAGAGYAVLRFDYRGMGDSSGQQRSFESISPDIAAAIDALQASCPTVDRIVLWGLCDAASAALLYMQETADKRVAGLCLLNPWVRSAATLARTHVKHYYTRRLREKEFWLKLLSGKVAFAAVRGLFANLRLAQSGSTPAKDAPFQQRMAEAWKAFAGALQLILSGDDYTAKEFLDTAQTDAAWRGALERPLRRCDVEEADHTFSSAAWRSMVESHTLDYLNDLRQQVQ